MDSLNRTTIIGGAQEVMQKRKIDDYDQLREWLRKKEREIIKTKQTNPFWRNKVVLVEKDQKGNPYKILRKIDEAGYKKTHLVSKPGHYSHRGGLVDVYPYNRSKPVRIEFVGNKIENIFSFKPARSESIPFETKNISPDTGYKEGYYVVHIDHGIGIYRGRVEKDGANYIKIEYKGGDLLYVPEKSEKRITPYVGFSNPRIYRLGGELWQKTKKKAKEDTIEWAKKIIKEQAKRETIARPPFGPDDEMQKSLERDFPHSLTRDQKKALKEVKEDLSSKKPMDRLICGDVGFGKTEIALRAAFKVASAGKQVAFLTPTTILADQHFETFRSRLQKYPVNVGLLSRVGDAQAKEKLLKKIGSGKVDIVIGTHRLLSKDVKFADLGLIVIDEEQKFGVKHKQELREIKEGLDVLSLSATPIPRTLKLALSEIKDISLIKTPPPQKKPIETQVAPFKKENIKKAIKQELKRGGQVFYLHNRVQSIKTAKNKLKDLLPQVDFEILHAQMADKKIIEKMHAFKQGKFDVLVATTIIENGLDLDNVNTLIVENSDRLGLSQAHQLRGRIGRKKQKAYAWFFYRPENLTSKVKKRLNTLKEFSHLGAGFQIALKDLKMRGAGEILGKKQSGTIQKVGLNLYFQLLQQAIESTES